MNERYEVVAYPKDGRTLRCGVFDTIEEAMAYGKEHMLDPWSVRRYDPEATS